MTPPFSGSLASVSGLITLASEATIPATDEGLRRGAAGDAPWPRARGSHQLDLLGRGRNGPDTAARRAHPRLDHPPDRGRAGRRRGALVHARAAPRRGRGVPDIDDAGGAGDRRV